MVDKSDLDKLKGKLDIGGLVNSVKSMINPASGVPDVDPDDDLGIKIARICAMIKDMSEAQQEHVKNLNKLNELLNAAFADIKLVREELHAKRGAEGGEVKKEEVKAEEVSKPKATAEVTVETTVKESPGEEKEENTAK